MAARGNGTGNESVPIQLAQCRFPGLAISTAEILMYFSSKICGSNFIKQHSGSVVVSNYQNADCSLKKNKNLLCYLLEFSAHFRSLCPPPDSATSGGRTPRGPVG